MRRNVLRAQDSRVRVGSSTLIERENRATKWGREVVSQGGGAKWNHEVHKLVGTWALYCPSFWPFKIVDA